jgi:hypothetical protein
VATPRPVPRGPAGSQYLMPGVQQTPPPELYAAVTLRVEGHPVQMDPVAFHPSFEVPIAVRRDTTATPPDKIPATSVFVTLESLQNGVPGAMLPIQSTSTDANLSIPNAMPGLFHVAVSPRFRAYVSSLTSGGTDLLREPLRILPGVQPQPIEITLRDDFASLSVHIVLPRAPGSESLVGAGAVVACIPLDRPQDRPELTVETQQQVTFSNQAPGSYLVIAYSSELVTPEMTWQDPDALRELIPKGTTVTLTAGQQSQAEVPLQPEPSK